MVPMEWQHIVKRY